MNRPVTIQDAIQNIKKELNPYYSPREVESLYSLIFEHILKYSKFDIHLNKKSQIEVKYLKKIQNYINRLKKHEPIQYILGETEFYNLRFKVNKHTLIPRPETEELAHWILTSNQHPAPVILDIGTGSGCISVTLSRHLPKANVISVDISKKALAVAEENAQNHKTPVQFFQRDIFKWNQYRWENHFDIIVSNPPYVRKSEIEQMERNVFDYEPGKAIFVPDSDPLVFYRTIINFAKKHLHPTGILYVEINVALGKDVIQLMKQMGLVNIQLKKDVSERDRMISAQIS